MAERISKLPVRTAIPSFPSISISMGRAKTFQGIASILGGITNELEDQADRAAVVHAKREGAIAGAKGTPDLTGESTLAGEAFDSAARSSFANRIELVTRVRLNELAEQHKTNPAEYTKAAAGYLSGMVQEIRQVDPGMAALFGKKFELDIANQTQAITKVQSRLLAESRKADAINLMDQIRRDLKNIAPDIVSGDPGKGLEALERINNDRARIETILSGIGPDGMPMLNPSVVAKTLLDFDQEIFQDIGREWVRGQPDKVAALEAIESDTAEIKVTAIDEDGNEVVKQTVLITEPLTSESKEKLIGFVNKQVTAENRAVQADLRETAEEIADLEISIDNGTADLDDIAAAQDRGLFIGREQKRATLTKAWQTRQEKNRRGEVALTRVTSAINGELTLDPKSTDDKKAVDGYWQAVRRQLAVETEGAPEGQAAAIEKTLGVNLVRRTGMIPKTMRGEIVGAMRSGTNEQRIDAADTLDRLNQLPGNVLADEMTKSDIALGLQISSLIRAGQTPERAVEAAIQSTDPANKPVIEARQQTIRRDKLEDDYEGIVSDHFNPITVLDFIPFGPDDDAELPTIDGTKSRVIAEYKLLFEDWFIRTGDKDLAKKLALKDLDRVWGVTRVDGGVRAMKYAPEAFYGVGLGDEEWMKAQLLSDIEALKPGLTADEIFLGSDPRTSREAKARVPTYPVLFKNKSGEYVRLIVEGKKIRWHPDATETKRKLIKNKIDAAKQRRQEAIDEEEFDLPPLRMF